ncbi:MAG: phospholipid carrier-dependent glycosyltransferase [Bryobacteraceae bacterium]
MPPILSIVFAALLTLLTAYGLGRLWFRKNEVPHEIVLAVGAALLSLLVFGLLAVGLAGKVAFAAVAAAGISALVLLRDRIKRPAMRFSRPLWMLLPFGVLYLVHALAPEIQPDAAGYHLGNVAEYLRPGRFPDTVDFYEILPHGVEMLFAFAFSFGGHSAAKLVHFALFAASVPLIFSLGKRLGLEQPIPAFAAVFYAVTTVVGTTGTCAYVDAALAFYAMAAVYLVVRWHEEGSTILLVSAGLAAGFCYGVKNTGGVVAAGVAVWLLARRQWKAAAIFSVSAAAMIAPWMVRAYLMTGNPVAPLFNRIFPNPYFRVVSEEWLASNMRLYGGGSWVERIKDLAICGRSSLGLLGPMWLLAPLALIALRRPAGRLLVCAAVIAGAPYYLNTSARFLIPALPFLGLAIFMSLPRRLSWALVAAHAVLSWPAVVSLYADTYVWRLRGWPVAAALRIEPEQDYLRRTLGEYRMAEVINRSTPPGARILDLHGTAAAYTERQMSLFYESAETEACVDAMRFGLYQHLQPLHDLVADWPEAQFTALRIRQEAAGVTNWSIAELGFYRGNHRLQPSARWLLDAWPNIWDAPLALDNNLTTFWATLGPAKPGMFLETQFDQPQWLSGATVTCPRIEQNVRIAIYGRILDGTWRLLCDRPTPQIRRDADLRVEATRAIRHRGFQYIVAPISGGGNGLTGHDMLDAPWRWGVARIACVGNLCLFRIL